MNKFPKPKYPSSPPGYKGPGGLILEMYDEDDPRVQDPPREVWRVVDGDWKLVSLVRPDGTLEPLPPNPPSVKS